MIVDLITNNEDIVNYVKEKEGYGGKIEEKDGKYKLINVQIGYLDDFYKGLEEFIKEKNIDKNKYSYRVLDPRGIVRIEEGNLS